MSNVKILKTLAGQEVIAKVLSDDGTTILCESPLILQPVRTESDGLGLTFLPFTLGGNQDQITLKHAHVLCVINPEPQLSSQYLAGLAGISIAPAGSLPKISLT